MKKIFLSGDPTHPLYHRYQNVAAALDAYAPVVRSILNAMAGEG